MVTKAKATKTKKGKKTKKKFTSPTEQIKKRMETTKDIMEAGRKLNVHQEPRSKQAARIRHMLDQPRKRLPKSPHRDIAKPELGQRYPKMSYATGGSVSRGQYASQPKKVKFKGVF
mgnify:CR=1 FL=1